jgi:hypothetical protein
MYWSNCILTPRRWRGKKTPLRLVRSMSQHCRLRTSKFGVRVKRRFNEISLRFMLKRRSSCFKLEIDLFGNKLVSPMSPISQALKSSFSSLVNAVSDLQPSAVTDVSCRSSSTISWSFDKCSTPASVIPRHHAKFKDLRWGQ